MFRTKLQKELASQEGDVSKLLAEFFRVDDGNIAPLQVLLRRAGAVADLVPRARRRHPDHQGLHQERLRAVGEPARVRHVSFEGSRRLAPGGQR
jgi:hypothetical protein